MFPMAISIMKSGPHRDTPATSIVSPVRAMNHVSARLYTSDTIRFSTTGSACLK